MLFDFVRLLLCYRVEEEPGGRREVCLVLGFKMNIIKWKLHFVSCIFSLKFIDLTCSVASLTI